MENYMSKHTESMQLTCTDHHIAARVTWGKMVAACTFCNIIKVEIEKLNCIVNSLSLKAEILELSVCSAVELSHSTQTIHTDGVDQRESAYRCASFPETKPYPEICVSTSKIENVDSHVTKETEVCEMNGPTKEENTLLTIKVERSPEVLCNTEGPLNRDRSYNHVINTEGPVGMECSLNHVRNTEAHLGRESYYNAASNTVGQVDKECSQGLPIGAAQVEVDSDCACCEDIKADIDCIDGYRNAESKPINMELNTIKRLTGCAFGKDPFPEIKDDMAENLYKMSGQTEKREFDGNKSLPFKIPSELDSIGLEELLDISTLESSVATEESPCLQSKLPQKASQLTLYDQADNLVHNEPENMKGQQDGIDEDKQYLCEICAKRFSTPDGLSMHCVIHFVGKSNEEVIGFEHSVYEFVSKEQHRLFSQKYHTAHTVEKPYKCTLYGKGFVRETRLVTLSMIHTGEKPYACKLCNKRFHRSDKLTNHQIIHKGERPYKCYLCDKGFIRKDHLLKHNITHRQPYKDNLRDKRCNMKKYLNMHNRTHTGEKPYICEICGKGFNGSRELTAHTTEHTEMPYHCDVCSKRFPYKSKLLRHNVVHTGEKAYKCDICGKAYASKQDLAVHLMRHTGEKPHVCTVCNRRFIRKDQLTIHHITHTGEKPYKCDICG